MFEGNISHICFVAKDRPGKVIFLRYHLRFNVVSTDQEAVLYQQAHDTCAKWDHAKRCSNDNFCFGMVTGHARLSWHDPHPWPIWLVCRTASGTLDMEIKSVILGISSHEPTMPCFSVSLGISSHEPTMLCFGVSLRIRIHETTMPYFGVSLGISGHESSMHCFGVSLVLCICVSLGISSYGPTMLCFGLLCSVLESVLGSAAMNPLCHVLVSVLESGE